MSSSSTYRVYFILTKMLVINSNQSHIQKRKTCELKQNSCSLKKYRLIIQLRSSNSSSGLWSIASEREKGCVCGCRNGSDARGYFVWSFLDVFELLFGYASRFGLCGVDMNAVERTRYMRNSARWYSSFLKGGELRPGSPSGKG